MLFHRPSLGWFCGPSISAKLTVALGSVLILVVALGLLGLQQLRAVNDVTKEIREIRLPQLETLEQVKRLASEHRLLATRRTQTTNFHELATAGASMKEIEAALINAEQNYLDSAKAPEELSLFSGFQTLWANYRISADAVLAQLEVGELSAAHREFNATSLPLFDRAFTNLDRMIAMSKDKSRAAAAGAQQVYRRAILLTTGAIALAAMFVFAAILWTTRNVSLPILRVSHAMRCLADGDETVVNTEHLRHNDEIAVLVAAVSGYRNALLRSRQLASIAELERERLQVAITNMPIGLCMVDRAERLIICNSSYAEMYQLPAELVRAGSPLNEIYHRQIAMEVIPRPGSPNATRIL